MDSMFKNCINLEIINAEFDLSEVTNMNSMFYNCENIKFLNFTTVFEVIIFMIVFKK